MRRRKNHLLKTAAVCLVVIVAYDKYKGTAPAAGGKSVGFKIGH